MLRKPTEITDTHRALQLVAWILLVAMVLMTIWPFDLSPENPVATDAGRIEAYGVLAAAFLMGHPNKTLFALILPFLLAIADEVLPLLFLGHHLNIASALWKMFGIGTGTLLGLMAIQTRAPPDR